MFGKAPSIEDVEHKKTYSLEKAREELLALALQQFLGEGRLTGGPKTAFQASFKDMDRGRQELILQAMHALIDRVREKPKEVAVTHCQVLTAQTLEP